MLTQSFSSSNSGHCHLSSCFWGQGPRRGEGGLQAHFFENFKELLRKRCFQPPPPPPLGVTSQPPPTFKVAPRALRGPARQDLWTRGLLNAISCSFQVFSTVSVGQQVSMLKYRPEQQQQQQFFLLYLEFTFFMARTATLGLLSMLQKHCGSTTVKHVLLTLFLSQLQPFPSITAATTNTYK